MTKVTSQSIMDHRVNNDETELIYIGPRTCQSNVFEIGYEDISILTNDMKYDSKKSIEENITLSDYLYVLCPNTIFTSNATIKPMLNNTSIKCGNSGSSLNQCHFAPSTSTGTIGIKKRNFPHVAFGTRKNVENVTFQGIKFVNSDSSSSGLSIGAWGNSNSQASFYDCHWYNNTAFTLIEIYDKNNNDEKKLQNATTKSSMKIHLDSCTFKENTVQQAVILNAAGVLQIYNTSFIRNSVQFFVVGGLFGASMEFHNLNEFVDNSSPYFTAYLDFASQLKQNKGTSTKNIKIYQGRKSQSKLCPNQVFLENEESFCLYTGGVCHGICCAFGNVSCSNKNAEEQKFTIESNLFLKNSSFILDDKTKKMKEQIKTSTTKNNIATSTTVTTSTSTGPEESCGPTCIGTFVIVLVPFIILSAYLTIRDYFLKKHQLAINRKRLELYQNNDIIS